MGLDDYHLARDEHGALVATVQRLAGLPDDSFGVTAGGHLLVEGTGWNGDLTRAERNTVYDVANLKGYVVVMRDGAAIVKTGEGVR